MGGVFVWGRSPNNTRHEAEPQRQRGNRAVANIEGAMFFTYKALGGALAPAGGRQILGRQ